MGSKLVFRSPTGKETRIETQGETSVMEAAIANGVDAIVAECRGSCACATCHVIVAEDWLNRIPPAGELESEMLEILSSRQPGSRLSCQIAITSDLDGLTMTLPESQY